MEEYIRKSCVAYRTASMPIIDVINVYNVYKKFFVNAFIILSTFMSFMSVGPRGSGGT